MVTAVSVPTGVKIKHLPGRVTFFQGGRISFFSMEYVKYQKVTKCKSVI